MFVGVATLLNRSVIVKNPKLRTPNSPTEAHTSRPHEGKCSVGGEMTTLHATAILPSHAIRMLYDQRRSTFFVHNCPKPAPT